MSRKHHADIGARSRLPIGPDERYERWLAEYVGEPEPEPDPVSVEQTRHVTRLRRVVIDDSPEPTYGTVLA